MGKGRSRAPQPTEQTVVQSNLPKYFEPYAIDMIKRAEAESKREYTPYEGQRLADESGDLLSSRSKVRDIAGSGIAGLDTAQSGVQAGMGRALQGLGYQAGQFDSAAAQQYMSPYMQNVVDVQKAQAMLDFDRAQAGRDAQAVQAGAFGGSRQAVAQALAGEDLQRRLGEIQATGQQKAFENAQQQFERDRAARESAERQGITAGESLTSQSAQLAQLGDLARKGDVQAAQLIRKNRQRSTGKRASRIRFSIRRFCKTKRLSLERFNILVIYTQRCASSTFYRDCKVSTI